ncbi:hypothetical protein D1610_00750 [Sphingomonas gilva]|uniref:Peptidase A2 domain-containing protein n=1 Tax=Sphingomonas gilva TaxID=2305907 RepID=A0A396RQH0_9SPHN|nr:aspartyl protease family protein [Sphingomonas gilva]RHW18728.1 hypothetical protein D1610_00750 [Sphingomonas gilva]
MRIGRFAVVMAALATAAGAQEAAAPHPESLLTVALAHDRHARMTIPVTIDGKGPFPFVVDTGAERTSISAELAAALNLPSAGNAMLHSVTGMSPVGLFHIDTIAFDRHSATDLRAPAMAQTHMGAPGLIGVDSLSNQRVTLNFRRRTMTIAPTRTRDREARSDDIIVRARSLAGRMVIMDAAVDGEKVAVILDTGSQASLGNEALRKRLFAKRPRRDARSLELRDVTGGTLTAIYTTTRSLRISDMQVNNLPIAFADAHVFAELDLADRPAMLLGMDALRLFDRVTIDFGKRRARFLRANESHLASW